VCSSGWNQRCSVLVFRGLSCSCCILQQRDSDPSRFSNRGGQLLKDQALKKQLNKELPRIEKTLKEMLKSWEDDHERFFMVHDNRYIDTLEQQWKEKETSKTMEKAKRVRGSHWEGVLLGMVTSPERMVNSDLILTIAL